MIVIITVKTDSQTESLIETDRKYYNLTTSELSASVT